jgi:hypothetical protein
VAVVSGEEDGERFEMTPFDDILASLLRLAIVRSPRNFFGSFLLSVRHLIRSSFDRHGFPCCVGACCVCGSLVSMFCSSSTKVTDGISWFGT